MKGRTWAIALWICAIAVLQARCQDLWKTEYASSYKLEFFDASVANFDAAKAICDGRSAIMIRMDNEQVRNKVYETISSAPRANYFWIGAKRVGTKWRWLGETTDADTTFFTWYPSQPDNVGGQQNNLVMRKQDGQYLDIEESSNIAGTICQKIPDPWKTEYASSYKLEFFDEPVANFGTAKTLCDGRSAKMIRMDNAQVRNKVYETISSATVGFFWIGATGTLVEWTWLGESSPADTSFIEWYGVQPDNYNGQDHNLIVRKNDGKYGDIRESFDIAGTICQKMLEPWKIEVASNYKLEFFDFVANFDTAKEFCTTRLGKMMRMDDEQVKTKVYETITSASTVGYFWIGATLESGEWRWLGEDTAANTDFLDWVDGQPDNSGDRLIVGKAGKYSDATKDFNNAGTICQFESGTTYFGGYRLEVFYYGVTYSGAKDVCKARGGMLLEPRTEDMNDAVKGILKDGYGHFIGLKYISEQWKWESDQATAQYTIWDSSQTANSKECALIKGSAGLWRKVDCTDPRRNYACQTHLFCNTANNACKNGGTCSVRDLQPYYECNCVDGYYGQNCSEQYCAAHPNKCKNGGTCSSSSTSPYYSCRCADGYYGNTCTDTYCQANTGTCQHGGTCNSQPGHTSWTCSCLPGYHGNECANTYCQANPGTCEHGGTCTSQLGKTSWSCNCRSGYYGNRCANTYCQANPGTCQHGGTCNSQLGRTSWTCSCRSGFHGNRCADTYCQANPGTCQHGGTCNSQLGLTPWTCSCKPGYYGNRCGDQYCVENPNQCKPAGTCLSTSQSPFYTCQCDENYHGYNCTTGVTNFNGYRLETFFEKKTYQEAKSACEKQDGILFEPRSEQMNNAFKTLLKGDDAHYIGLRFRRDSSNKFAWLWTSDSKKATLRKWKSGFPKNIWTNYCVGIVGLTGLWENIHCGSPKRNYACQTSLICDPTASPCLNGGTCSGAEEPPYYKCVCARGYYEQKCTKYLEVIVSGNVISVAGYQLLINATVIATETRVNVSLHRSMDLKRTIQNVVVDANTTAQFQFYPVNKSIDGTYTILATTVSGEYIASASFRITVHENVEIEEINPKSIFSPVTNGSDRVVCQAIGTPQPSVAWYLGTSPVKTSSTGVYQTTESQKAYLHVSNAKLADNGKYTCNATNQVGPNDQVVTDIGSAFLAVYGKPTIRDVSPEQCSANAGVKILWAPNNQTTGVVHRLTVQPLNATIRDNVTQMTANNNAKFDILLPSTKYQLQITVCPDQCISKLNAMTKFTTGVGLPGELHNPVLKSNSDSFVCVVTWDWPTATPVEQISHVEVTWEASLIYTSENSAGGKGIIKNVSSTVLQNNISKPELLPNRNYSVSLRAFTCAGPGPSVTANGTCVTEPGAPTIVKKPNILDEITSDGLRKINVALPDESNGRISCIFVVVTEGESSDMNETSSGESLKRVSFIEQRRKPQPGESYIAIAIPRANFTGSTFATKFGDNATSYCDPADSGNTMQTRRKKRELDETGLRGKNWPLVEGSKYSIVTVTTTPTSSGHVHYGRSEAASFVNNKPFQYTLTVILIVVAVIAIGLSSFGYYRYKHRNKRDIEERPEENPYENILLKEQNSETAITLSTLLDVYKAMTADSSLKFREEFQELKSQAKAVMTPATVAGNEEMAMKNRYKNILPFDATRVALQGEGYESYINACRIKGKDKNFIATQGPLPITVGDFWKMVVENKVKIIVMLAKCREAGKHKCAKYWPDVGEDVQHGNLTIENADERYFGGYVKRTFKIFTPQQVQHTVLQFQFLNWPDHGVPATTSSFFRLHKAVMDKHEELGNDSPLLVHCSAGVGRTGTFIGYDILLHESTQTGCVDIFACVLDMRRQRVEMVQTSAQYELLHKLLLENHMFGQSDISKDDLTKMQLKNGPVRKRLQREFQNLSIVEPLNAEMDDGEAGGSGKVIIVRQPEDTEWISIDASSVEAFDHTDLIAAHGPFKSTIEYFWRAVLDNNTNTIVMLNSVDEGIEDPQTCTVKYWPESNVEPVEFNNVIVQLLDEQLSDGLWTRNMLVSKKNQPQKKITHYQYLGWPSGGVPRNTAEITDLASKIPRVNGVEKPGAVLIHCSDGLGRTGAFCTILNIIARMKIENHVDVFRAVKDLRNYRPGMVKTLEEYTFCYKAAQAYLEASNIYTEVSLDRDEQQIYENLQ